MFFVERPFKTRNGNRYTPVRLALEPQIELAQNYGLNSRQVNAALKLVNEHEDEIREAWEAHFES